jgi:hypothetical protein
MTFQAYLDSVKAKTGMTPAEFAKLAHHLGLQKHGEIVAWLKAEYGLGHGHAGAIAAVLLEQGPGQKDGATALDRLFSGRKSIWRGPCDRLISQLARLGPDVSAQANATYVNLLRGTKKFGILQPASTDRLDVGIKLKKAPPGGRFEAAASWNAMVTHRVRISSEAELDAEVARWLEQAYSAAI